jgi:hypothetical protein
LFGLGKTSFAVEIAEYLCVSSVRVRRMPLVDGLDLASLTTHGANYDSETDFLCETTF